MRAILGVKYDINLKEKFGEDLSKDTSTVQYML